MRLYGYHDSFITWVTARLLTGFSVLTYSSNASSIGAPSIIAESSLLGLSEVIVEGFVREHFLSHRICLWILLWGHLASYI